MAKPFGESPSTPSPLAQRGALVCLLPSQATTCPGQGTAHSHSTAASFGDLSLLCTHWHCSASRAPALLERSVFPPALLVLSKSPRTSYSDSSCGSVGGRMAPSLSDGALSSAPGRLLFSQHQDIESRAAPRSLRSPRPSPGCWDARRRSSYPATAPSPGSPRTLDPLPGLSGSEPAETRTLGTSSSGRAPEPTQLVYSPPQIYPVSSNLPKSLSRPQVQL